MPMKQVGKLVPEIPQDGRGHHKQLDLLDSGWRETAGTECTRGAGAKAPG